MIEVRVVPGFYFNTVKLFLHPCGDDIMLQFGELTRMSTVSYCTGAVVCKNIVFWSCIINGSKDLFFILEPFTVLLIISTIAQILS